MLRKTYHFNLNRLLIDEIEKNILSLSSEITYLDLSGNVLPSFNCCDLIRIAKAIKNALPNLDTLNLSDTNLGCMSSHELEHFFSNLPKVKSLYLKNNNLHDLNAHVLQSMISKFEQLDLLDLENNQLSKVRNLELIFKPGYQGPRCLYLSNNNIGSLNVIKLKKFLSAIPAGVKTLDLQNNLFLIKPWPNVAEFKNYIEAFNLLPETVNYIDLSKNCMSEDLLPFMVGLKKNIEFLGAHNKKHDVNMNLAKKIFENMNINDNNKCIQVDCSYQIDEIFLNRLMVGLDKCKHSASDLVAALLLENRIENIMPEYIDEKAYMAKRTHDAITYYIVATKTKELNFIALELLQEIYVTTKIPSVKNRMDNLTQFRLFDHKRILPADKTEKQNQLALTRYKSA